VPMSAFFDVDVLDFSELSFIMFLHFEKYVKKRIIYLIFNSAGKLECASPNTLSVLVSKVKQNRIIFFLFCCLEKNEEFWRNLVNVFCCF